ncbi:MAG: hypothetical protein AUJ85_04870 [Elusimicrobia bacterium CG1_02_37_114]|nr:MAG: hypothetical protein AUJ85_04870 [Elusimicrobia bacterium CG1_02_37_114]PIV53430.1 MAG: hypothetical protein COS17_03960 [Elusimicrobia bacterium CG02_land_8_20_14_3_00_37_13]PIZ13836.1 MAG: hypothetical protein COY53_02800 [Elusimicrobia bacterium CG_4_10_14_0_8_um_filter_37_32]
MKKNYEQLKDLVLQSGGALFGVCNFDIPFENSKGIFKENIIDISPEIINGLNYAISIGVRLSDRILEDIKDHPTKLYFYHYRQINYLLDRIALLLTGLIQEKGHHALPIPSSQTIDWEKQKGHLSHKEVARRAGLGWPGRNNLLVHPVYGSRIRLVTVLTDMPLSTDKPIEDNCGDCTACISVCPAGAIKERRQDFDHKACFQQLDVFRKKYGISHHICGICVQSCKGKR